MECYHCETSQAKLKCADCDSEIFRFCSNQCGVEAHDDHKVLCYNRNSIEQVKDHLYDAIDEMHDQEDIAHALEVVDDLIEAHQDGEHDEVKDVMAEAHEIIQGHIEMVGFELVGRRKLTPEEIALKKKKRTEMYAKRNTRAGEDEVKFGNRERNLAQKREDDAKKGAQSNLRRETKYSKKQARAMRRAQRYEKKAKDSGNKARNPKVQKPGMREKMVRWRKGRAQRRGAKARQGLDQSSGDDSSGM